MHLAECYELASRSDLARMALRGVGAALAGVLAAGHCEHTGLGIARNWSDGAPADCSPAAAHWAGVVRIRCKHRREGDTAACTKSVTPSRTCAAARELVVRRTQPDTLVWEPGGLRPPRSGNGENQP